MQFFNDPSSTTVISKLNRFHNLIFRSVALGIKYFLNRLKKALDIHISVQSNNYFRRMSELLFSYGTLQKEKIQIDLFGRILKGADDALKGFSVSEIVNKEASIFHAGEPRYHLIAIHSGNKNDSIKGTVLEITAKELEIADGYEPADYKRVQVLLESGKEAWVYVSVESQH